MSKKHPIVIYTIGHSTHSLEEFIVILQHYGINCLVDIRTIPRSAHNPQFNEDTFSHYLKRHIIAYFHVKELGGLRHPKKNSINTAWRNASFRGFADYMQTEDYKNGLFTLLNLAETHTLVLMCSEALPWRCHRSLIADSLTVRGIQVFDIFSVHSAKVHHLTPWAQIQGNIITYPQKDE